MLLISTFLFLLGGAVGGLIGWNIGYFSVKSQALRQKAQLSSTPEELAQWRDTIKSL